MPGAGSLKGRLDVDSLAAIIAVIVRGLEDVVRVIGVIFVVLEDIIFVLILAIKIGSSRELGGRWISREVGLQSTCTTGSTTSVGAASPARAGSSTRRARRAGGTALASCAGLGPCVQVFPPLEPRDDLADQSEVATQHPQVEAI